MAIEQALTVIEAPSQGAWAVPISEVKARVAAVRQLMADVLEEGADYDKIPGVDKPSLTQVGGQTLMQLLNARPDFEKMAFIEDFDRPLFNYVLKCNLISLRTGEIIGAGVGSCNSHESKYRWRQSQRKCPKCGAEAILRSKFPDKNTKDLGWYCFSKKGGCGAQFKGGDPAIINQQTGRTENEDVADQANTILKMAKKRAMVDATLNATGANRLFTQDLDEPHIRETVTPTRQVDAATGEVTDVPEDSHPSVKSEATSNVNLLPKYGSYLKTLIQNHNVPYTKPPLNTIEDWIATFGQALAREKIGYVNYDEWLEEYQLTTRASDD